MLGRGPRVVARPPSIAACAACGQPVGGAIGQWIGVHAPGRLTKLVLANTSPQFLPRSNWENRIKLVQQSGMVAIADVAMQRFFSADTLARNEPHAGSIKAVLLGTNSIGYLGCCAALRDFDFV